MGILRLKIIAAAKEAAIRRDEESLQAFLAICQEAIERGVTPWDIKRWVLISQK